MEQIVADGKIYSRVDYESESDLEQSLEKLQEEVFGTGRIYLPVKKLIGRKGGQRNIPDGYLIDLAGPKPRLFVVENELASHDPLSHIALQILEFSLAFEQDPQKVKSILLGALKTSAAETVCKEYAAKHNFRNLDHMMEFLVFDSPFSALVVIDQMINDLEDILGNKFQFAVEVIEFPRFETKDGDRAYIFDPLLSQVATDVGSSDIGVVDTVVIPARPSGFKDVFLGQDRWYAVRIQGSMRPQIKYIAAYQVAPISAITHIAPVQSIESWKDSHKYVVNFAEPATSIGPIVLVKKGRVKALQNLRYTHRDRIDKANTLDDIW